jgi:hypothetical protein
MRVTSIKALVAVTAVTALGLPVAGAQARHGADDAPGHVRHSGDDAPGHVRHSGDDRRSTRPASRHHRRGRHGGRRVHRADDGPRHVRHGGNDDGPNHT